MTARRRLTLDPSQRLARLVERLGQRYQYVTLQAIEAVAARPSSRLPVEEIPALVEAAVHETLLLKDLRTFYDRATGEMAQHWVYRVNPRHPIAAGLLADADP